MRNIRNISPVSTFAQKKSPAQRIGLLFNEYDDRNSSRSHILLYINFIKLFLCMLIIYLNKFHIAVIRSFRWSEVFSTL